MRHLTRPQHLIRASAGRLQSPAVAHGLVQELMCAVCAGIDRGAFWIYGTLAAFVFATCNLAIGGFTIETDEANLLLSTFKAFGEPVPGADQVAFPAITSGGIHFLIHGLLGFVTRSIVVHRAVSLLFLAALVVMVFALLRRRGAKPGEALMGAVLVLATPGLLLQGALAMAEIMATVLLLMTLIYWDRKGRLGLAGSAFTGILLGLTCATRTNCLVCIPAVCLFACLDADSWPSGLSRAGVIMVASVAVYALGVTSYVALFTIGDWDRFKEGVFSATGVAAGKTVALKLLYVSIAADFFPPALIGGLLLGLAVSWRRGAELLRLPLLLICVGLIGAASWILKAPIPHVRYAWPFAPLLFVAAGLLFHLSGVLARLPARLAVHCFVVLSVVYQTATSLVYITAGDSLVAVYLADRQAGLTSEIAKRSDQRDQRAMAGFIAALPKNATVFTPLISLGFPITYLAGREIRPMRATSTSSPGPIYFLLSPADYAVYHPSRKVGEWLRRSGVPVFRSGDYTLFAIVNRDPYPFP